MDIVKPVFSSVFNPTVPDVNWNPLSLFSQAEPGVWYDPSDITTLFQDSTGLIPVTAFGQAVGKILDKSGRGNHAIQAVTIQCPIYGTNPIVGTRNILTYTEQFDNAAWTKGNASVTANGTTSPNGSTTADKLVEDNTTNAHSANILVSVTNGVTYTFTVFAKAAERSFIVIQPVSDSRYAYFNLSNGTVGTTNGSPTSTSIVDVGGGWYRCSITIVSIATAVTACYIYVAPSDGTISYAGNGTSGVYLWGAQAEEGSTATAYQKVVSQYEVTQAGVQPAYYLAFDGVDDFMVTSAITPSIDKTQAFAGVRKLDDAVGMVYETGPGYNVAAGTFALFYFSTSYRAGGGGTSFSEVTATGFSAPVSTVFTLQGDISASLLSLRTNGSSTLSSSSTQGTGNYLTQPLYIGLRAGIQYPFNGRIYSLIVRFGANLTAGQITSTESYVNSKTGAY